MSAVTRIRRSEELTVPFTRDEVWAALTDFAAYSDWWPAGLGVRILAPSPGLPSGQCEVRRLFGQPVRFHLEELEPPSHIRLRFFGGGLEGPGGFHLTPANGATSVVYSVDVFARSLPAIALSFVFPIEAIHALRMRRVLRGLRRGLKRRRTSGAAAARLAAINEQSAAAERQAAEAARQEALRAAETLAAEKREAEAAAVRAAEEETARQAALRAAEALAVEERAAHAAATEQGATEGAAAPVSPEDSRAVTDSPIPSSLRALAKRLARWLRDSPRPVPRATVADTDVPKDRSTNLEVAHAYVRALCADADKHAMAAFFEADAEIEEIPSIVLPEGAKRDRDGMLEARLRSRKLWSGERFDAVDAVAGGSQVAMEVRWTGAASEGVGPFKAGESVEARMCLFLKFHEQRITRERIHVCYQALSLDPPAFEQAGGGAAAPLAPNPAGGDVPALRKGSTHFEIARSYFEALSSGAGGEAVLSFFAPGAIQEDYPHYFHRTETSRDRRAIQRARDSRLAELRSEHYELMGAVGEGARVALEVLWTGVVGAGHARLEDGARLESRLAVFLCFEGGLILRQRTYESVPQVVNPVSLRV